jgi:hypothetical protein
MRDWFLDTKSGKLDPTPQLWGSSRARFDNENDLVALRVPADQDRLSEFIMNYFGGFFKVAISSFKAHSFLCRGKALILQNVVRIV